MKALIDDPGLFGLYESWRRKRGAKAFPSSLDLELSKLRFRVWPSIGLIDIEGVLLSQPHREVPQVNFDWEPYRGICMLRGERLQSVSLV